MRFVRFLDGLTGTSYAPAGKLTHFFEENTHLLIRRVEGSRWVSIQRRQLPGWLAVSRSMTCNYIELDSKRRSITALYGRLTNLRLGLCPDRAQAMPGLARRFDSAVTRASSS